MNNIPLQLLILYIVLVGLILGVCIPLFIYLQNRQKRAAFEEGAKWCQRVHGIYGTEIPAMTSGMSSERSDAWQEGYLAVLDINGLQLSDKDREELHNNPYIARDAVQRIAMSNFASSMNISNSINSSNHYR